MPGDPYSDPATGVLLNKLGLDTAAGLEAAEREITHAALILLHESPVPPTYDLRHLCEIHRRIFGDIYDWAGQIRTGGQPATPQRHSTLPALSTSPTLPTIQHNRVSPQRLTRCCTRESTDSMTASFGNSG